MVDPVQLTSVGYFNDRYFHQSIAFGTEENLIMKAERQLVRVDLQSGKVEPIELPIRGGEQVAPGGGALLGTAKGKAWLCVYETNANEVTMLEEPGEVEAVQQFRWLDAETALILRGFSES